MNKVDFSDIKALFAEVAEQSRQSRRETDRAIMESRLETDRRFQELERVVENTSRKVDKMSASIDKTEKIFKQQSKQFGEMGNAFGVFTEGLVGPSVDRILMRNFKVEYIFHRARSKRDRNAYEFDVFGYANGDVNVAVIVEIKSNAKEESVEQLLEHLGKFPALFPDFRSKKLYGVLAAVNVPDNVRGLLRKHGLHLICPHEDIFRLSNAPDFISKNYQLPN